MSLLHVDLQLPLQQFALRCAFEVQAEVVVLFGPSGAGKTSVLDCIAGFRRPAQGRVQLGERVLCDTSSGVDVAVRERHVGYLSQQPALFPHLTVRQNVEYGLLDLPRVEREARADSMLRRFKIATLAASRPAAISGGEQQRVALARTLVREPELLLLDEPLAGLDLALRSLLLEMLFDWQYERAIPMLYVTHDQQEAGSLARRVIMIEKGSIVADGEPWQIFRAPLSREQAVLTGFENVFDAVVEEIHPELGTMLCRVNDSGMRLEAPLAQKSAGDAVVLASRAGDVLVAVAEPSGLSARNLIAGCIQSIEDRAGMVELQVLCGEVRFYVHITRGALRSLHLQNGQSIWLVLKTHSIQLLRG
jgi:molybdate transport system ATP-binding protein